MVKKTKGGFSDSDKDINIYVDPETGVNYIIYDEYGRGGICPRLNADGTVYLSK